MKIIESRARREGPYAGHSQGKHHRYSSSYGWKRLPLNRRKFKVDISGGIGFLSSTVLHFDKTIA